MKRLMVNFFFPHDYDEILFYTSYTHGQSKLFEGKCSENLNISSWRKDQNLGVTDVEKIKEVEQDQVLTQFEELEDKEFEERSSIKDGILEEVFEEAKEGNLELIEENGQNLAAKIIGNIVEDSTEVKHKGESITHYSQDLVDLLKISTIQSIDFLGVENFNFVFKPLLVNIANQVKGEQKKFWVAQIVENNSKQVLKMIKYSKYHFIWSGRFQFSKENSRSSFIQVEEPDVGQEAKGSHNCEMIFNILFNFRYFRNYDFISLILGVFMNFLVKLKSCYDTVLIRICLGIFLLGK